MSVGTTTSTGSQQCVEDRQRLGVQSEAETAVIVLVQPVRARRLLDVAAVVGRDCEFGLLETVSGLSPDNVDTGLAAAVASGLTVEVGSSVPVLHFQHKPLLSSAVVPYEPRWRPVAGPGEPGVLALMVNTGAAVSVGTWSGLARSLASEPSRNTRRGVARSRRARWRRPSSALLWRRSCCTSQPNRDDHGPAGAPR
jgi:hypothetical protein